MSSVRLLKRQLRKEIQQTLNNLTESEVTEESKRCATTLFQLPQFIQSRNVSIYLSMPSGEIQTSSIVEKAFQSGKRVFVPFIESPIIHMVEAPSLDDVKTFKPNRWGIPEPPSMDSRANALDDEGLDLIVVPGYAFDRDLNRIGHGKGYYDSFIQRCHERAKLLGKERPALVALALEAQLLEKGKIPMTNTDWKMDFIIAGGELIGREDI